MRSEFDRLAEEMRREIDDRLSSVGILFRAFARGKNSESLQFKISRDPGKYSINGKRIQDAIGIRIALYFPDDVSIVKSILEAHYTIDQNSSTIDQPSSDEFAVTRYNLIFRLPPGLSSDFIRLRSNQPLDDTFEVQLRSILSEGWHEVEHDLRYKSKDNWNGHEDLSRVLNGIVATLETSEWTMGKIFEELAYRHYRTKNWGGMLPAILRMRLRGTISSAIASALDQNAQAAKDLLRIDRAKVIKLLSETRPKIPVTPDNIVQIWNLCGPRHDCLLVLTSEVITEAVTHAIQANRQRHGR